MPGTALVFRELCSMNRCMFIGADKFSWSQECLWGAGRQGIRMKGSLQGEVLTKGRERCELQPAWWPQREGQRDPVSRTKATGNSEAVPEETASGFLMSQRRVEENRRLYWETRAGQSQGMDFDPVRFDSPTCLTGLEGLMAYSYRNTKPEDKHSASSWSVNTFLGLIIYKYCLFAALQPLEFPPEFKSSLKLLAACPWPNHFTLLESVTSSVK